MSRERWPGGYISRTQGGEPVYVIEQRVGAQRFHASTRCHSLRAAMRQYERFQADPLNYRPEGEERGEPLYMTKELVLGFYQWQFAGKGVTKKHANEVGNRLAAWTEDLHGVDLRRATLVDHIKPALDTRVTMRGHRISSIKAFYAWLRTEKHLLTSAQDPTLDMPVPASRPEKHVRRKAVPFETVQAVASKLKGRYRDVLVVLAATGWHFTELSRFIKAKDSEIVDGKRGTTIAVLVTKHKGGEMTRTPVTDQGVLDAATRLRACGKVPKRPNNAVKAACAVARVEGRPVQEFTLGVMRHSVATWGIEGGALPAEMSEFLGHKDPRTTRRFYADVSIPTVQVPLPKLRFR